MKNVPLMSEPPKLTLKHVSSKEDLKRFDCGVREIDRWATEKAYKLHERGRSRVTIANPASGGGVCGFYSLTHSIAETGKLLEKSDRDIWDKAPIIYIGYMAVAKPRQRTGIGSTMLVHALHSAYRIHQIAPLYGVGLRALNEAAERLYTENGFRRAPNEDGAGCPLMILPIWTAVDLFSSKK
ncbi:MAG: GNAT family N-acetyltransferase [Roseovarius sp.]